MTLLRRSDLEQLLAPHRPPCVSIYLPTARAYPETDQNPIRFKNLLRRVEESLGELARNPGVGEMLERLRGLAQAPFWSSPRDGVAIFAGPGFLAHYLVPVPTPERLTVADSFHVRPLLRLLGANRSYLLLTVSLREAALFQGSEVSFHAIEIDGLPVALPEAVGRHAADQPSSSRQRLRGDGPPGVRQGMGEESDFKKSEAAAFFRSLDDAVCAAFREEPPPLVVGAAAPYLALYREVSHYPNLVGGIEGNFEHATLAELHERSLPVASEYLGTYEGELLAEYDKAVSRGQTADEVDGVARAAVEGRVRVLFVAAGRPLWGSVDRQSGTVKLARPPAQAPSPGEDDVVDDLIEIVLARRGDVVFLAPERVPGGREVAALLRW